MKNKWLVGFGALLVGGNANNGANDGLGCTNANNAPSNANTNIGSRNYFLSMKPTTRPLGRKFIQCGLVGITNISHGKQRHYDH